MWFGIKGSGHPVARWPTAGIENGVIGKSHKFDQTNIIVYIIWYAYRCWDTLCYYSYYSSSSKTRCENVCGKICAGMLYNTFIFYYKIGNTIVVSTLFIKLDLYGIGCGCIYMPMSFPSSTYCHSSPGGPFIYCCIQHTGTPSVSTPSNFVVQVI